MEDSGIDSDPKTNTHMDDDNTFLVSFYIDFRFLRNYFVRFNLSIFYRQVTVAVVAVSIHLHLQNQLRNSCKRN